MCLYSQVQACVVAACRQLFSHSKYVIALSLGSINLRSHSEMETSTLHAIFRQAHACARTHARASSLEP